jgi:hypothetical protein
MAQKSSKKGPHSVKTTRKPQVDRNLAPREFLAEVNAFIADVHETIQEARSKMSAEDVERADKKAEAILKGASDSAKSSRRTA